MYISVPFDSSSTCKDLKMYKHGRGARVFMKECVSNPGLVVYLTLLKTGSLDNAIREFSLS